MTGPRQVSREIRYRLADNTKRLRLSRGYTQKDLAARSCMCDSYICKVEQGSVNITLGNLEALAAGIELQRGGFADTQGGVGRQP